MDSVARFVVTLQSKNDLYTMTRPNETETPELVVMLTCNDFTIENAGEVFEQCKDSLARFWGMKELPLPLETMKSLYARMRDHGITTVLETVTYDEAGGLRGAHIAAECGCDILMGTKFHESIAAFCRSHDIRYMPFVGTIHGRPSVLSGTPEQIVAEAREAVAHGAYGVDLLGYRYVGDPVALNTTLTESLAAPVCIAGSVDSYARLDEIKRAAPRLFTIGSAFFHHRFGDTLREQIDNVCRYMSS